LERYVEIAFVGEKMHFSILFDFPLGVCKTSKEKPKYWFFIFGYPFSFFIGDALSMVAWLRKNKGLTLILAPQASCVYYIYLQVVVNRQLKTKFK
jgi:hypothetical protein